MVFDLLKLQDGNVITGVASEGISGEEINLTEEVAGRIAGAFVYWLSQKVQKNPVMLKVCIGYDSRPSAEELRSGALKAMNLWGAEGHDAGLATAPAMFMSTVMPFFEFDGAIMITAGNQPYNRNGFRFYTAEGILGEDDITDILKLANKYIFIGEVYDENRTNVMQMYAAHLRQTLSMGLKDVPGGLRGMRIVVCADGGIGDFFAKHVLEPMGALVSGKQMIEPDLILQFGAGANLTCVAGPDAKPISGDGIIALASAIAAKDYPGGTVVTDSITSDGLHEFLEEKLGLKHLRYKTGCRNIICKAIELQGEGEQAFLAADTDSQIAYSDNYFMDDGLFLALQTVINATKIKGEDKDITALIEGFANPAESAEVNLKIDREDFDAFGAGVLEDMEAWIRDTSGLNIATPNYEGVRANYDLTGSKGWFMLRTSANEPVMTLNIESDNKGGCAAVLPVIMDFIMGYEEIVIPHPSEWKNRKVKYNKG